MKVRKFRILRLRHHVSMVELGRACGVSAQRISELEARYNPVAELQSPPAIPPIDKAE